MSVTLASVDGAPLSTGNLFGPGSPAWWLPPAVLCALVGGVPLARKPLFRDEMATYIFSRLGLAGLWSATRHVDGSMVLYYALMHLTPIASARPVALRLWSLAAAVLTVAIVARVGASLWQGWVGLLAGSVLALNGAFLTAADTARPAALACLFGALATLLLVRARAGGLNRRGWAAYALCVALSGLCVLFAVFLLAGHAVAAVLWLRSRQRAWFCVAAVAGLVPVAALYASASGQGDQLGWITATSVRDAVGATTYQIGQHGGDPSGLFWSALVVLGIAIVLSRRRARTIVPLVAMLVLPTVELWVTSQVLQPVIVARYLIFVPPASALVIAGAAAVVADWVAALTRVRQGSAVAVAATTLVIAAVLGAALDEQLLMVRARYSTSSLDDFPRIATRLRSGLRPGQRLVLGQNYDAMGRVAGVAFYTHDAALLHQVEAALPSGVQLVFVRRVVRDTPFATAATPIKAGRVLVLDGGGAPAHPDAARYYWTQLERDGCRPDAPAPAARTSILAPWTCP